MTGPTGIGYESQGSEFRGILGIDVEAEMLNGNPSVFVRVPFTIADQSELDAIETLILKMRYDDGFVAYLNGGRIAAANADADTPWNAVATAILPPFR